MLSVVGIHSRTLDVHMVGIPLVAEILLAAEGRHRERSPMAVNTELGIVKPSDIRMRSNRLPCRLKGALPCPFLHGFNSFRDDGLRHRSPRGSCPCPPGRRLRSRKRRVPSAHICRHDGRTRWREGHEVFQQASAAQASLQDLLHRFTLASSGRLRRERLYPCPEDADRNHSFSSQKR